jgi:hypothetical protein
MPMALEPRYQARVGAVLNRRTFTTRIAAAAIVGAAQALKDDDAATSSDGASRWRSTPSVWQCAL